MLSKKDLQDIDQLLSKRIKKDVGSIVSGEMRPVIHQEVESVVTKKLNPIKKDIKTIVRFFDKEYLQLKKEVNLLKDLSKN